MSVMLERDLRGYHIELFAFNYTLMLQRGMVVADGYEKRKGQAPFHESAAVDESALTASRTQKAALQHIFPNLETFAIHWV
jgi:hypothetical protein